jgi:sulfoxide reductase heme-binding subunit YedZ
MLLLGRAAQIAGQDLGPNPIETLLHTCGKTALNLLLLTLAVTPARILTGMTWLVALRRRLGLFAFFYATVHFSIYVGLDRQPWDWAALRTDLLERPYITLGFTALVLMLPLAATSTATMQRRLGRRWKSLHRLVYPIGALAVTHYWWQAKRDPYESLLYVSVLAVLLGIRLLAWRRRNGQTRALSKS